MAQAIDIATTFVHLRDGGGAEPIDASRAFWSGTAHHDRALGAFDFASARDLHSSMQEMHPAADEVLLLVSGALDVVLDEAGAQRAIALKAGEAAIVPRGVWHHLVMREPGRLVFINSRTGMESRPRAVRPGRKG